MKKEIKQYGNSAVIVFDKEMMRAYKLKIGDILNFRISVIGRKRVSSGSHPHNKQKPNIKK